MDSLLHCWRLLDILWNHLQFIVFNTLEPEKTFQHTCCFSQSGSGSTLSSSRGRLCRGSFDEEQNEGRTTTNLFYIQHMQTTFAAHLLGGLPGTITSTVRMDLATCSHTTVCWISYEEFCTLSHAYFCVFNRLISTSTFYRY